MLQKLKTIWGSGQSRGFKLGAWAVAITAFGAYQVMTPPTITKKTIKADNSK